MTPGAVLSSLDRSRDWALDTLKSFLRIPSISARNTGIREASEFVRTTLGELGFDVRARREEGYPVLLAERKGPPGSKTLLFYNHYDVQPPEPLEEWESPPFEPTVREGKLFARGVADNKANFLARVAAVRSWVESTGGVPCTVRFLVEGEEEIGSGSLPIIAEREADFLRSDLTVWESAYRDEAGRPEVILGCQGIVHARLECRKANMDLHSSRGGIVPNPIWRLAWALASMKGPDERVRIAGFHDDCIEPTEAELELLRRISFPEEALRARLGLDAFLDGLSGFDLVRRYWCRPSFNVNGWGGGYQGPGHKTVLPKEAFVKFDIRLVPDMRPDRVEKQIRDHLDRNGFGDVRLCDFRGYPAARTPPDDPMVRLAIEAGTGLWDREFVVYPHMVMSGPMYLFRKHAPCVGLGVGHAESNNHAPNESIFVDDYHVGAKHIARLMGLMGHGENH